MKTLCSDCALAELTGPNTTPTAHFFNQLARGDLRLTLYPKNCDNARQPGHSQRGPYTLDELPPSARA